MIMIWQWWYWWWILRMMVMIITSWCIDDDDEDDLLTPINHMTPHERAGCPKPFVPIGRLPFRYLIPHIRSCQSKIPRSTQIGHFVSTWVLLNEWSFVFVEGSQKWSAHASLRILKQVVKASKTCKNCEDLETHKAIRTGGDLYQLCQFAVI